MSEPTNVELLDWYAELLDGECAPDGRFGIGWSLAKTHREILNRMRKADLQAAIEKEQLKANRFEVRAEDADSADIYLDDLGIPRTDSGGNVYSITGRIDLLIEACTERCVEAYQDSVTPEDAENFMYKIRTRAIRNAGLSAEGGTTEGNTDKEE